MTSINWNDNEHSLAVGVMDDTHREFVALYNQVMSASDETFAQLFETFFTHTEAHFLNEDRLMEQSGFPALSEHRGEHQRVLNELRYFLEKVRQNKFSFARFFLRDRIPGWFNIHLQTMDSALAAHLKQNQNTVGLEQAI